MDTIRKKGRGGKTILEHLAGVQLGVPPAVLQITRNNHEHCPLHNAPWRVPSEKGADLLLQPGLLTWWQKKIMEIQKEQIER